MMKRNNSRMKDHFYRTITLCIFTVITLTGCHKALPDDNTLIKGEQNTIANVEDSENAIPPVFESDQDFYCWILDNMVTHSNEKDWEWFTQTYEYCNATAYYLCDINDDGRDDLFITGPIGIRDEYRTIAYITSADGYDAVEISENSSTPINPKWMPIPENGVILDIIPSTYVCDELGYSISFYQEHFVFTDGDVFVQGKFELDDAETYFIQYENMTVGAFSVMDNSICWDYDEPYDLVMGNSTFVIPSGTMFKEETEPKYYAIW